MKIILTHGVFDLFHPGHVEHLRQASKFGDHLVVSVLADKFVQKGHPLIYTQDERLAMVASCKYVHQVELCEAPGPQDLLQTVSPHIYVRGSEYLAQDKPEYEVVRRLGILVGFTNPISLHTTEVIQRVLLSSYD